MPKVSVIIPVYGAEKYIERCARSLFGQTLDDVEYIFVDDCTPDRSMEVLRDVLAEYPARRPQVKILRTDVNSGQHVARQLGIEACTGDYVTHCDPDDAYSCPDALESAYLTAIEDTADIVWWDMIVENELSGNRTISSQCTNAEKGQILETFLIDFSIMASLCNRLVKSKLVKLKSIVKPVSPINEDTLLVAQYHLESKTPKYLPRPFYVYFRHSGSTTGTESNAERLLDRQRKVKNNFDLLFNLLQNNYPAIYKALSHAIDFRKYHIKSIIVPALTELPTKMWTSIYPEINFRIYLNSYLSLIQKRLAFMIESRIFRLIHK